MTWMPVLPALALQIQAPDTSLLENVSLTRIGIGALVLAVTALLIRWLSRLLNLLTRHVPRARFLVKLIEPAMRILLWFMAMFIAFSLVAPSKETFIAAIASIGLALGLGAQDLIKNAIGGLVVLGDRPYQLGDRVRIGQAYGEIDLIGLRSTKLTTPDDTRVTIPNADILTSQVFNANSGVPDCQVVTDLFLPIDTDPELAVRIGYEAAACSPYLLARKPIVTLLSHGFDQRPHLRLRIKAYVHDHRYEPRMQSDVTARASKEFLRRGVLQEWRSLTAPSHRTETAGRRSDVP
jgi:MscS family membrane protein